DENAAANALYTMDLSGDLPRLTVNGVDGSSNYLGNPANYAGWKWHLDNKDDNKATQFAWRSDMDLAFDDGFARSLKAGVRYTDRKATNR
ncbi:hypothetical protein SB781_35680, partial [Paraburkholderia sp. SIMBA_061]